MSRVPTRRPSPRGSGAVLSLVSSLAIGAAGLGLTLAAGGCYGFAGGGLPPGIHTVAVLPFENLTSEPALTQAVNASVRDAVEGRLGLRAAGQAQADALVRGSITRYEPDVPVAYTGDPNNNRVNVTRRLVQITVNVQIVDQRRNGRTLWERQGLTVEGDYDPGAATGERDGRDAALKRLETTIVEGAQSQW